MTTPAHIAAGYIISKVAEINNLVSNENATLFTACVLAGSTLPDIDAFFGKNLNEHRNTLFHAPIMWLVLLGCLYVVGVIFHQTSLKVTSTPLLIGILSHFFLDWYGARTSGVRLYYPFSTYKYSLFPLRYEKGNVPVFPSKKHMKSYAAFWSYYANNRFLLISEIAVIILGVIIF